MIPQLSFPIKLALCSLVAALVAAQFTFPPFPRSERTYPPPHPSSLVSQLIKLAFPTVQPFCFGGSLPW